MSTLPLPPVPKKLPDILSEYPEKIEIIQDILIRYCKNPSPLMPFDGAVWLLKDVLDSFYVGERDELGAAESSGDPELISRARKKERLMRHASSSNRGMSDLSEISVYIEARNGALL